MLLGSTKLPFAFFHLLAEKAFIVDETFAYRPDKLVATQYEQDFFIESMCNEASNVSPISANPGVVYLLPSRLFLKHFLEAGNGSPF